MSDQRPLSEQEKLAIRVAQAADRVSTARMVANHDADTITTKGTAFNNQGTVRLYGIDALEMANDGAPEQRYAAEQAQGLRNIVRDQLVRREGPQETSYGRTVSRLRLQDGRDVGEEMVRNGYAAVPPAHGNEDPEYHAKLQALEAEAKHLGKGMWNPLRDVDPEMPWDQRNRIFREKEKALGHYTKQESILDDIGGALTYVDNVARSAIDGAIDPKGTVALYAQQALNKQRETSGGQLKDHFTKNILHMPKPLRMGDDDGKFDFGDIGDAAVDLGVEVLTSPTTALTIGPAAKAIGAAAGGAAKAIGLGEKAVSFATKAAPRTLLGAAYGAGIPGDGGFDEKPASVAARVSSGVLGGLAAAIAPAVAGKVAGAAGAFTDGMTDWYMRTTRAVQDYSNGIAKPARENVDKAMNFAAAGSMSYKNKLRLVDGPDRIALVNMIKEGETWEVKQRLAWHKANPGSPPTAAVRAMEEEVKARSQALLLEKAKAMGDHFVQANKAVFDENEKVLTRLNAVKEPGKAHTVGFGAFWPDIYAAGGEVLESADSSFAKLSILRKRSQLRAGSELAMAVEAFAKSGGSGLAKDDAAQAVRILAKHNSLELPWWEALVSSTPSSVQKFIKGYLSGDVKVPEKFILQGIDDTVDVYFRKYGWHSIDKAGREAIEAMADVIERAPGQGKILNKTMKDGVATVEREQLAGDFGGYKTLEKVLHGWDVAQTFVVRNQLFFGASWLKNNFYENSLKAYMSGGLAGVWDSSMFNAWRKGTFNDIWDMTHGSGASLMAGAQADDLARAVELGVVSNPSARALGSGTKQDLQKFMYSPAGLARAGEKAALEEARHPLEKGMDRWGELLAGSVGRLGSTLENNSRFAAWVRMRDAMVKGGKHPKDQIEELAADAIKRTFYDYSDISEFNRLVVKRIFPYASYYLKNIPYYIGGAFDMETLGKEIATRAFRTQIVEKAISHFGGTPTDRDKAGFNDYIIGNRPRILGRDEHGGTSVGVMPSFSRDDAIRMAGLTRGKEFGKAWLEKVNPMLKAPYELLSGNDLFTGEPLTPSGMPEPKKKGEEKRKYLFGPGHWLRLFGAADVDERGNPYTTSDTVARLRKIQQTLLPMPGVDALASVVGESLEGKRSPHGAIFNKFLSPVQELEVSKRAADMTRTLKKKEKGDGK